MICFIVLICCYKYKLVERKDFFICILLISLVSQAESFYMLNIDRSRSFYLISWISQNKLNYNKGEIEINVKSPEAKDKEAIEFRLEEQISRKIVKIELDKISLTILGKLIYFTSEKTSQLFSLKGWKENKQ